MDDKTFLIILAEDPVHKLFNVIKDRKGTISPIGNYYHFDIEEHQEVQALADKIQKENPSFIVTIFESDNDGLRVFKPVKQFNNQ